jgi:hypothetical protein
MSHHVCANLLWIIAALKFHDPVALLSRLSITVNDKACGQ